MAKNLKRADTGLPIYVRKHKNGPSRYVVRYRKEGKEESKTFDRKIDALEWYKLLAAESSNEKIIRQSDYTIGYAIDRFLKLKKNRLAGTSYVKYESTLRLHVTPYFAKRKLNDLTFAECEQWLDELVESTTKNTANEALRVFKQVVAEAVRWGYLKASPIIYLKPFKVSDKDFRFWGFEEKVVFMQFLNANYPSLLPVFLTALTTGMRLGELQGLMWDCVDFNLAQITIMRIYCLKEKRVKKDTKSHRIRRVPMNAQLKSTLVAWKNAASKTALLDHVFPETNELKFQKLYLKQKALCKEARVSPIKFHDLRHTFASHFMMAGGNIYDLQKILGHSSIEITERYSHLSPEHLKGATDKLEIDLNPQNVLTGHFA